MGHISSTRSIVCHGRARSKVAAAGRSRTPSADVSTSANALRQAIRPIPISSLVVLIFVSLRSSFHEREHGGSVPFSQLLRNPYEAMLVKLHAGLAAAGFADSSPAWGTNVFHHLRGGGFA